MLTKEYIEKYFLIEKQDGLMMMIAGLLAIVLAVFFFIKGNDSFSKGVAIILLATGIWQMMMGFPGFMHSDAHRIDMVYAFDMNPNQLKEAELPRVEKTMKNMRNYRILEACLFAVGLTLFLIFYNNEEKQLWVGLGLGLAAQVLVIFIMDHFAAKRAEEYWFYLKTFVGR